MAFISTSAPITRSKISVTKIFYDKGWSGINVEPGPIFETLQRHRRRDINLRLAVSDHIGETDFYLHEREPGTSTLSPDLDPNLAERVPRRHRMRVPVTTLSALIDTYAPDKHIHFLKLDVEGAEEPIIKSTDWRRYRPELLIVEATAPYSHARRDDRWNETLEAAGYSLVFFDGINVYYLREESAHRKDAFGLPVNVLDFAKKYEFEKESATELEVEVAELTTDIAALRSEHDKLLRRLRVPDAPAPLWTGLAVARLVRAFTAAARSARRYARNNAAVLLERVNSRLLLRRRQSQSADEVEDALLTLELRAHERLPAISGNGRKLARIAEAKLRRFALSNARPTKPDGDQA